MRTPVSIRRTLSKGFSLISAIFLIVVLAGLGVAMMFISTMQHQSSALDVQGVRAYQAARAGIEWGLYQRLRVTNSACSGAAAPKNLAFPTGNSLHPFTVTVICTPNSNFSATTPAIDAFRITAVACNMPNAQGRCVNDPNAVHNADFVQRVVEVKL
jgi:MSHA biogenesis protein MshP